MKNIIDFDVLDESGPQAYSGTFEIPASELARDEIAAIGPIALEVRADKGDSEGEYVAEGTAGFTADLNCSRCAEPYPFANNSSFHVRFRPRPEAGEEEEVEIAGEEELDVEFYSERQVPLRDLALEQLQLSIPMKPLCDESCLGLCPKCGANRSREKCTCEESAADERWDALRGIREQLSKKNNQ